MMRRWLLAAALAFGVLLPTLAASAPPEDPLVARLVDSDDEIRRQAAAEFRALPIEDKLPHLPALLALLSDERLGWEVVGPAGWCGEAALPGLERVFASPAPWVRRHALAAVVVMDPPSREAALPLLVRGLDDPDARVRAAAASGLSVVGPAAAVAVPAMSEALDRADRERHGPLSQTFDEALYLHSICLTLVRTLRALGPDAAPAASSLVALLERPPVRTEDGSYLRPEAVAALQALGAPAALVLPVLVRQLPEPCCAAEAVGALAALGDAAVPALEQELAVPNAWIRERTAEALGWIATPAARAALARLGATGREESPPRVARREATAPLPPSPDSPWPLDEVRELPVALPGGEVLVTVHSRQDGERPDVVTIWRQEGEGWRRLLLAEQDADRAVYRATGAVVAGREILHLVRERDDGTPWRLDRVWWLAPGAAIPLVAERPASGCGAWLPELGKEETLGAAFELTPEGLRFGFAPNPGSKETGPPPVVWQGTLAVTENPAEGGAKLAVVRCAEISGLDFFSEDLPPAQVQEGAIPAPDSPFETARRSPSDALRQDAGS